jgi:ADP-ribose pyrophosphatase YjhB (NUDIX family)
LNGEPDWLRWARELQALGQNGLAFTKDPYDAERFEAVRRVAAEMMARGGEAPLETVQRLFDGEAGYATPKIVVRAGIIRDESILMVRETTDGRWSLPGGWADPNASPAECMLREIEQETGYTARLGKLAAVYDRARHPHHPPRPFHIYMMFFLAEITGGAPRPSIETSEIAFFRRDALPELSQQRITAHQIERMFRHHAQPDLPTEYD